MKKERRVPIWCLAVFAITAIIIICHVFFYLSKDFADYFNMTVGAFFRTLLAKLSGLLPFSLAETVIITLPVVFVLLCIWAVSNIVKHPGVRSTRTVLSLFSVLCILYGLFTINFASAYRGRPLDEKLGIKIESISAEQLKKTTEYFRDRATEEAMKIAPADFDGTVMPYSLSEMSKKLNEAYSLISKKYGFVQNLNAPIKYIALSKPMTYTHISGVYTFFTSEANININFPDYTLPYTAAHEMSHQRGIAPEDEANFMAFLVCSASGDAYIRYSGYISMYEYLLNALYDADKAAFYGVVNDTDERLLAEMRAFNKFFSEYNDNSVSVISNAINDSYLKLQGESAGTESYDMVVDLAVAWYEREAYNSID